MKSVSQPKMRNQTRAHRRPKRLKTQLAQLTRIELIKALPDAEVSYLFRHALVQETAYQSLLKNDRRRLHRAIAMMLEQDTVRVDENAAELAQHYAKAGLEKSANWYEWILIEIARNAGSLFVQGLALRLLAQTGGGVEQFKASLECFDAGDARLEAAYTREMWADWEMSREPLDQPGRAGVHKLYADALAQFDASQLTALSQRVQSKLENLHA